VIKQKAKGKKVKIKKPQEVPSRKTVDIMGLLKESLEDHKKKKKAA
jgi:non-homologous end joining protein Ku